MEDSLTKENNLAIEAAKYLVQLYMSTRYECNRQKLQKLVLFSHFALLLDSKEGLLGDEQITVNNIGLGIDSISEKYRVFEINSVNKCESMLPFISKENCDFTEEYRYNEKLLSSKLELIKNFFMEFGAYDKDYLSHATKKIELYPSDSLELQQKGRTTVNNDQVNEYISHLKNNYNGSSGFDIISSEIHKIFNDYVLHENGEKI